MMPGDKKHVDHTLAYIIAKLGEDGWEMVGIDNDGGEDSEHVLYFKRQLLD